MISFPSIEVTGSLHNLVIVTTYHVDVIKEKIGKRETAEKKSFSGGEVDWKTTASQHCLPSGGLASYKLLQFIYHYRRGKTG